VCVDNHLEVRVLTRREDADLCVYVRRLYCLTYWCDQEAVDVLVCVVVTAVARTAARHLHAGAVGAAPNVRIDRTTAR
jgi:hypothetical protein